MVILCCFLFVLPNEIYIFSEKKVNEDLYLNVLHKKLAAFTYYLKF